MYEKDPKTSRGIQRLQHILKPPGALNLPGSFWIRKQLPGESAFSPGRFLLPGRLSVELGLPREFKRFPGRFSAPGDLSPGGFIPLPGWV